MLCGLIIWRSILVLLDGSARCPSVLAVYLCWQAGCASWLALLAAWLWWMDCVLAGWLCWLAVYAFWFAIMKGYLC
jgi:hypothetical protein